jgi:hypothetical protein
VGIGVLGRVYPALGPTVIGWLRVAGLWTKSEEAHGMVNDTEWMVMAGACRSISASILTALKKMATSSKKVAASLDDQYGESVQYYRFNVDRTGDGYAKV